MRAGPRCLLDGSGTILRANPAAVKTFGPVLEGEAPLLSAIWSAENGMTPEQFLAQWGHSPAGTVALKFLVKGGGTGVFSISICSFSKDGEKFFVFQAAPETAAGGRRKKSGSGNRPRAKAKTGLRAATGADGVAGFQQRADEHSGAHVVAAGQGRAGASVAAFAAGGGEIGGARGGNFQRTRGVQPAGNGGAPRGGGKFERGGEPLRGFFRNAPGAAIAWKLQLEKGLFAARFDEAKLQQALMKVLENAVEAVAGGGGQITVQTRNLELTEPTQDRNVQLAAGTYVCVEIADNGAGIEPDVLPRIFEPFFTTKGRTHRGLGLALAYGIVSNHGGGVAVSGQPGAGTSVRIYLPAEKQLAGESAGAGDNLHGSETVLVVDDEAACVDDDGNDPDRIRL